MNNSSQTIISVFPDIMTEDYSDMIRDIGELKFKERFTELLDTMDQFLQEAGYTDNVKCNERIVLMVLLDYWSDLYRMKDFHLIEKARTEKIFSYLIAWIIKRKPLQFVGDISAEKDVFVNERFCTYLLLNECLLCGQKKIDIKHFDKLNEYVDYVMYYLKYRECNSQTIELMIRSFEMGTYTRDL